MANVKPSCTYCRFSENSLCHRYPPTPVRQRVAEHREELGFYFPVIFSTEWCGEFRHDKAKFASFVLTDGGNI